MSKRKPFEYKIEEIYNKSTVDVMMVTWVEAVQSKIPINTRKCIRDFYNHFHIAEDDYSMDSAYVTYSDMKKALDSWDRVNKDSERQDF